MCSKWCSIVCGIKDSCFEIMLVRPSDTKDPTVLKNSSYPTVLIRDKIRVN